MHKISNFGNFFATIRLLAYIIVDDWTEISNFNDFFAKKRLCRLRIIYQLINFTTFKENFCFLKQVFKKIAAKLGNSPPLASRAGLPSKYRRGSMLLNFGDRTTTGVYSMLRGSPHHHPLLQILFES